MKLETWINGELKVVNVETIWQEAFTYWDTRVDTQTAARLASEIEKVLRSTVDPERFPWGE